MNLIYRISWPTRPTFSPPKCDLNSTCVLCTEGKYYRIFRPITRALSIQKGSEIIKNEHARYMLERFPTDNARIIYTKKVSENTVLCIKHNFQLKLVCSMHSVHPVFPLSPQLVSEWFINCDIKRLEFFFVKPHGMTAIRMPIFKKGNRKSRVKNDFKTRCTEWCNFLKYKKFTSTFQAIGYKRMMQPTQLIFQGQWTVLQLTTDH